jgi:hypothetical protein
MREGAVQIVDDEVDEPDVGSPPPIWVGVVVVLAVVGAGWLLTLPPDGAESAPVVTSPSTNPERDVGPQDPYSRVVIQAPGFGPGDLSGDVVLTSTLPFSIPASLWVIRPSGAMVRLPDVLVRRDPSRYPLLITSDRIAFANYGSGYLLDVDAATPAEPLLSATSVIPGSDEGLVWFVRSRSLVGDINSVTPVDVDTQAVGQEIDVTDLFSEVVAGVGDGLVVKPTDDETYGEFAFWSPSAGLEALGLGSPDRENVVSAAGDLAIVANRDWVGVFDPRAGEYVMSFSYNLGGTVTSACLSPNSVLLVVVGSNGAAFIGNRITGQLHPLDGHVQESHGVGWTSDDQLVYLTVSDSGRAVVALNSDESGGEIAFLKGGGDWLLATSGSMC